ncbi:hypothetical protein GPECTOR_1g819 [Gonium pectorale]|uniref:Uncharacterized protein n=1 Tax=Gonium pectorale TaxID=33097 RepID=A0A150H4Y5_GONPE|nr:hypothetical protein GPECTOR_1g819 [Gonium pectorale]|eukprot:KXZ56908.1 hypothetical protein GPECTOR_1g819 [Gonium pectorale]
MLSDLSHFLADLPLWRADSAVLVGQQALLHIHTPHYVHLFDSLFASGPGPWLFGHINLPAGSRNLGDPEWSLTAPESRAPRVGVLMEVHRAVRLEDGKLMVLATALCRIRVRVRVLHCHQETPYSRAAVALAHEEEVLESHHADALREVLRRVPPPSSASDGAAAVADAMRLAATAAQAAASAAEWHWHGYEASTARAGAWVGRCPAEGTDPWDTRRLVTELVDHGVLSVLPFPDGPVIGRWDLEAVGRSAAEAAAAAAAATVAAELGGRGMATAAVEEISRGPLGSPEPTAAVAGGVSGAESRAAGGPLAAGSVVDALFAAGAPGAAWAESVRRSIDEADAPGAFGGEYRAYPAAEAPVPREQQPLPGSGDEAAQQAQGLGASSAAGGAERHAPGTSMTAPSVSSQDRLASSVEPGPEHPSTAPSPPDTSSPSPPPPPPPVPPDLLEGLTGHTLRDLLLLEARLWRELDSLAVLTASAHGRPLGLPLGLLQLRPSDDVAARQLAAVTPAAPLHPSGGTAGSQPAEGSPVSIGGAAEAVAGRGAQQLQEQQRRPQQQGQATAGAGRGAVPPLVHPASEGLDVYCHPDYPIQRRTRRLSYAAANVFLENHDFATRQELLECTSVRQRLIAVLCRAREAHRVLAALAAVKGLRPGK